MNRWIDSPGCPDSVELDRFVNSELSRTDDELIESHVEKCQECQGYLASKSHQDQDLVDWVGTQQSSSGNALYRKPLIEGYEIIELHKTGGQGILYKARDIHLERVVAIKLLRNYGINKFKDEIPLIKEARTIARLSHPNIVKLHGMTRTDRGPCMIMDWVEGGSLLDYLQ